MRKNILAILVIILLVITIIVKIGVSKNTDNVTHTTETESNKQQTMINEKDNVTGEQTNGYLKISIDFNRSSTPASNQYAVWIEDMDGNVVKTLFATNFTSNGGYAVREDSIPTWVAHAKPSDMDKTQIDAISGATP